MRQPARAPKSRGAGLISCYRTKRTTATDYERQGTQIPGMVPVPAPESCGVRRSPACRKFSSSCLLATGRRAPAGSTGRLFTPGIELRGQLRVDARGQPVQPLEDAQSGSGQAVPGAGGQEVKVPGFPGGQGA